MGWMPPQPPPKQSLLSPNQSLGTSPILLTPQGGGQTGGGGQNPWGLSCPVETVGSSVDTGTKATGERMSSQSGLSPSAPLPCGQGAARHSADPAQRQHGAAEGEGQSQASARLPRQGPPSPSGQGAHGNLPPRDGPMLRSREIPATSSANRDIHVGCSLADRGGGWSETPALPRAGLPLEKGVLWACSRIFTTSSGVTETTPSFSHAGPGQPPAPTRSPWSSPKREVRMAPVPEASICCSGVMPLPGLGNVFSAMVLVPCNTQRRDARG